MQTASARSTPFGTGTRKPGRADRILCVAVNDTEISDQLAFTRRGHPAPGRLDDPTRSLAWRERQWLFEVRISAATDESSGEAGAGGEHLDPDLTWTGVRNGLPPVPGLRDGRTEQYGYVAKARANRTGQFGRRHAARGRGAVRSDRFVPLALDFDHPPSRQDAAEGVSTHPQNSMFASRPMVAAVMT